MMSLPIPSLDSFISLCERADPLLRAITPPLLPRRVAGYSVTAHLAADRVRSLKDIALMLQTLAPIAPLFRDIDTSLSPYTPPVEETTAVLVSPRREYNAIMDVLREWKSSDGEPATERKHNNHYHLPNLSDEFHCMAEAADYLGEVVAAGEALIRDSTSDIERRRFTVNLRCILDLHRSELGKIHKKPVRGGVGFAHHKCRLYMSAFSRLAPLVHPERAMSIETPLRDTAVNNPIEAKRSRLREWLRTFYTVTPPDGNKAGLNVRMTALGGKIEGCADLGKLDSALVHATETGTEGLRLLLEVEALFK